MLITDAYRREQEILHSRGDYGTASLQFGGAVSALIDKLDIDTLLDYGCGSKRSLLQVLECERDCFYVGYDPGVAEFSKEPAPADLVCCIDVLEHIEPELLENVLDHLRSLSPKWSYMTVHTGPARKTLTDGRNAHLIQMPPLWWLERLYARWDVRQFTAIPTGFAVLCRSLPTTHHS